MGRKWVIKMDEKSLFPCEVGGNEQYLLIGYKNGLDARKSQMYFGQREKDNDSYELVFEPEPYYISYSFFNGFFNETVKSFCERYREGDNEINISKRKDILQEFCKKYTFSFFQNSKLGGIIVEYIEAMIENTMDIQAKVGNFDERK